MTASALLRPLLRRIAPMALLLGLATSCTDGGSPLSPTGGDGTLRLVVQPSLNSAATCTSAEPISRIRLRALSEPGGDTLHVQMFDVPPTAANWTLSLDVPVTAGITRVVVQMELISTTGGTEVVQCSGVTAPIVVDVERPTQAAPLVLFDGPTDNLRATAVSITTTVPPLSEGDSIRLAANITGPGSPRVAWRSLDADVATVSADGTVRLLRGGVARIVAEVGILSDTIEIVAAQRAASLRITQASLTAASLGEEVVFTAEVLDPRGDVIPGAAVNWTIDFAATAQSLGGGRFRALANGNAVVRAVSATNATAAATAALVVRQLPVTVNVTPASFVFTAVGLTTAFSAQALDARGNAIDDAVIAWSSSSDAVVAVTSSGAATARSGGAATLFARTGTVEGRAEVTVAQTAARLTLTPATARLESLGEETSLTARAFDSRDNEIAAAAIQFTSSNPSVAAVDGVGRVRAVGNGTATITAAMDGIIATATVVVQQRVATLGLSQAEQRANSIGEELTFVATALDARGNVIVAPDLVWSSAEPTIAESLGGGAFVTTGVGVTPIFASAPGTTVTATGSIVVQQTPAFVIVAPANFAFGGIGATAGFSADVRDARGTSIPDATVSWSSSNPGVVTVDDNGLATSRGTGSATIAARTASGVTGSANVTVERAVARLVITPPELALPRVGATGDLSLSAVDGAGAPIETPPHSWSSSNTAVATVDASGRVTATGIGTATITATAGSMTATATVSVARTTFTVDPSEMVLTSIGSSQRINAVVRDGAGAVVPNPAIAYASADPAIATVDESGVVTARAIGSTTVSVTYDGDVRTVSVFVRQEPVSITVTPSSLLLEVGASSALDVAIFDAAGHPTSGTPVFASTDETVATVSEGGVVTGVAPGSAEIRVAVDDLTAVVTVTVTGGEGGLPDLRIESITLDPAGSLTIGSVSTLTVRVRNDGGPAPAGTGSVVVYDGSGESVVFQTTFEHPAIAGNAFVDLERPILPNSEWPSSVVVRFSLDDENDITELNEENNSRFFPGGESTLAVVDPEDASLTITPSSALIPTVGGTHQFTAVVRNGAGDVVEADVTWNSSNPAIATVDENGLVTGVANGFTTIIASAMVDGNLRQDTVTVTVGMPIPEGVTTVWIGPNTTDSYADWNVPAHWSTGVVPGPSDVVLVPDCYTYSRENCTYPQLTGPVTIAGLRTGLENDPCIECEGPKVRGTGAAPARREKGTPRSSAFGKQPRREEVLRPGPVGVAAGASSPFFHVNLDGHALRIDGEAPDYMYVGGVPETSLLILNGTAGLDEPMQAQMYSNVSILGEVGFYNSYIEGDLSITGTLAAYGWVDGDVTVAAGGMLRSYYTFSMGGDLIVFGQAQAEMGDLYAQGDAFIQGETARLSALGQYVWVYGRVSVVDAEVNIDQYGGLEADGGLSLDGPTAMLELAYGWVEAGTLNPEVPLDGPAFHVTDGARFSMQDSYTYMDVRGDADINGGSTEGLLTGGELYIYGNLTVGSSPFAFAPSGSHTTGFGYVTETTHQVSFGAPGIGEGGSHFHNLELGYYSAMNFQSPIFVTGYAEMYNENAEVTGEQITILGSLNVIDPDTWMVEHTVLSGPVYIGDYEPFPMNMTLQGSSNLPYGFEVGGQLVIQGDGVIVRNDYDMGISGDLIVRDGAILDVGYEATATVEGNLSTANEGAIDLGDFSTLRVYGDATFNGGVNVFELGTLQVGGNLFAASGLMPASGTHRTLLDGSSLQVVDVADAFMNLTVTNPFGIQIVRDVNVNGLFEAYNTSVQTAALRYLRAANAEVSGLAATRVWLDFGNTTDATTVDVANLTFSFAAGDAVPAQLRIALPGSHDLTRSGFTFDPTADGPFIVVDGVDVTYRFDGAAPASPGAERFGGAGSIYYNGVGVHNPSNAPVLLGPPDMTMYHHWQRYVQMAWEPVSGAISYRLERETCYSGPMTDCQSWGGDPVIEQAGTSYTHNHVGDQPGRWRVRAVFEGGELGRFSAYRTFSFLTYLAINEQSPTMVSGGNLQLTTTINSPPHVPGISWTTSNPSVATVNASGLVTAVGSGTVEIRATSTSNPAVYSTTLITVLAGGPIVAAPAAVVTAPPGAVQRR